MLDYRALAESWRVLLAYRLRGRKEIISNCLCASKDDPWSVVSFFYPKDGIGDRLSDEDFREIFFLLTDAYPEEVEENPDPIDLLTSLSETEKTTGHAKTVVSRMHNILKAEDNEIRAWLIRPLFDRINKRDLHPFFMRLSIRASPVRRRDVIAALGMAYDEPFHHVRTAVNLIGLKNTVNALLMGSFDFSQIRPLLGKPLIISSPVLVESAEAATFTLCFAEVVEGAWVSLHHTKEKTVGFSASGGELPDDDNWMRRWAESVNLPEGVFLCDYAENRANPLMLIDWLNPTDPKQTFASRRRYFSDLPQWAVKEMTELDAPYLSDIIESEGHPILLRNARGILTYENTAEEVVLMNPVSPHRTMRVLSGRVAESDTGGAPIILWKLGVRDGFDYYPVAEVQTEQDFSRYCATWKRLPGEAIKIETPLFVNVTIHSSGWGDIGAYVNCSIASVNPSGGIAECMGVEELGYHADTD